MDFLKEEQRLTSDVWEHAIGMNSLEAELQRAEPATDNSLVREFVSGNDAAFAQLVIKYKDALINYVNMMIGDYDTAVDLCQ